MGKLESSEGQRLIKWNSMQELLEKPQRSLQCVHKPGESRRCCSWLLSLEFEGSWQRGHSSDTGIACVSRLLHEMGVFKLNAHSSFSLNAHCLHFSCYRSRRGNNEAALACDQEQTRQWDGCTQRQVGSHSAQEREVQ